jgi:hypothetical protein
MTGNPFYPGELPTGSPPSTWHVLPVHALARCWIEEVGKSRAIESVPATLAYVDLFFAFGLARLGASVEGRRLLADAEAVLSQQDDLHQLVLRGYTYRIEQALEGRPHAGTLPADVLTSYSRLDRMLQYAANRLRCQSRILEPQEKLTPYRSLRRYTSPFDPELFALMDIVDPKDLGNRIKRLLEQQSQKAISLKERVRTLEVALQVGTRLNETLLTELLDLAIAVLNQIPGTHDPSVLTRQIAKLLNEALLLLEHGFFVAACRGCIDPAKRLTAHFLRFLELPGDRHWPQENCRLAGSCLRSLRKLGLRGEIEQVLARMNALIISGRSLAELRELSDLEWPITLKTWLNLAEAWLYLNNPDRAEPILEEARSLLFGGQLRANYVPLVACAYAAALAQLPTDTCLPRLQEIFRRLQPFPDVYTTRKHLARPHLEIVESVVLALDELGQKAQG